MCGDQELQHKRDEINMHTQFQQRTLKRGDNSEDLEVVAIILLKWTLIGTRRLRVPWVTGYYEHGRKNEFIMICM